MQVDEQTAKDWLAHRKKKKADVSQTVIAGHAKEAQKAGISLQDALAMACVRGWAGFKAEWVLEPSRASPTSGLSKQALLEQRNAEAGRKAKEMLFGGDHAIQ